MIPSASSTAGMASAQTGTTWPGGCEISTLRSSPVPVSRASTTPLRVQIDTSSPEIRPSRSSNHTAPTVACPHMDISWLGTQKRKV
ncbi:hypothetical protein ORV05_13730 [Amycolatopsis cynarae]|uniref:Uncharacterized protein n=1 Tax=Amycolatopsis cynarae TaxID=2995223 RepID=A0ABY7BAS4_9PSEU|nr:hypothetical protein [Amycolatopsis sp. HUAS 11-8]WAL68778.1 hypothetical protein ORV05_13730 [Amycolatopsis sp. HUAS 11-8]